MLRHRFQFRLRTLLIAITVLSVAMAWFSVALRRAHRQRDAARAIADMGGGVCYDFDVHCELEFDKIHSLELQEIEYYCDDVLPGPRWVHQVFGIDLLCDVDSVFLGWVYPVSSSPLPIELPPSHGLGNNEVMVHLRELSSLRELHIAGEEVTDSGLPHLAGLRHLEVLSLNKTSITDAGLVHLMHLKKLKQLNLSDTAITEQGLAKLQKALPDCEIRHSVATTPRSP